MFNKKNPMRYFSGSTFARLPLYKLAAGGTAVALTASIGLGAFAAGVTPFNLPTATPAPVVTATPQPPVTIPQTGDSMNVTLLFALALCSGAALGLAAHKKNRS